MFVSEFIKESYDLTKARIEHPEDLVIKQGSKGAELAVRLLAQAAKDKQSVSIKPDGKPAIMWGRDDRGVFGMGDKYMNPLPTSPEQLAQMLLARKGGGREGLIQMYQNLWQTFEASVPGLKGYLFGDLMYASMPPVQNGFFQIKPNTVLYQVAVNSELGNRVAHSRAGIVVHSYFPVNSRQGSHITDVYKIPGVNGDAGLLLIDDGIGNIGNVAAPDMNPILNGIKKYGKSIDTMLTGLNGFSPLLVKYINQRVKQRNFDKLSQGFLDWLPGSGASGAMQTRLYEYITNNQEGFTGMFAIFLAIVQAKHALIDQFDKAQGNITASIKDEPGHEGYVVHSKMGPIKLIDRFKFSAANFGA